MGEVRELDGDYGGIGVSVAWWRRVFVFSCICDMDHRLKLGSLRRHHFESLESFIVPVTNPLFQNYYIRHRPPLLPSPFFPLACHQPMAT
jgi:hypothetical protein